MANLDFNASRFKAWQGEPELKPSTGRVWSTLQQALFAYVDRGTGNAIVEAVAGSGKSTTGVEMVSRVKGSYIYLAFNKPIAEELKKKGVNARTFHSLTYMPVTTHKRTRNVETNKLSRLCDANLTGEDGALYGTFIQRLVGFGRNAGIGCLLPDVEQSWLDLATYNNLELDNDQADLGRGLELASNLLAWSNASPMIDFDDMLYLAVKDGLTLPKFDHVFIDEAQDTNAIQRAIVRKIMHPKSRLTAIGDPAQAIYGFRGADSNSMQLIKDEFNCESFPLSITYRCPVSVVNYARQWVDHIQSGPGALEGEVLELKYNWNAKTFQPNDLVVSRKTAPMISLAFRLLRERVAVQVMGREIGQGLKAMINRMNARGVDNLLAKLELYREREVQKALAKKEESKVEAIHDKIDTIVCLIEGMKETDRTIPALLGIVDTLFDEKHNSVILATIHKAKGLEADRVFWLNRSECPATWARQEWQRQQEVNLCYVAATRAKKSLIIIETEKGASVARNEAQKQAVIDSIRDTGPREE